MADEIISPQAPDPALANPNLQNAGEKIVAPDMDNELDAALNAVFKDKIPNEEKPVEKIKEDKKQPDKQESKEDKPTESKQVEQGELPKPEEIETNAPGKSQAAKGGWEALRNNYKRAHNLVKDKEEEIRKLKTGLAEKSTLSLKEIEDLKTQVQELSKYRTLIDIQADPDFISKYDQPINKIQDSIKDLLGSLNVDKAVVDQVDFTNTKLMDQIIDHVGEHRDKITSKKLQRKVEEMIDLMDKRDETLSGQKTSYKDFIENKKKESSMRGAEQDGKMLKRLEDQAAARDEAGNPRVPFLNKMTPKDGASQAEVDQASKHNRMVDLMQQQVHKALKADSPEERTDIALAAVGSFWLRSQLNVATGKIKSLEEELKKISTAGSASTPSKGKPTSNGNPRDMDVDAALSQHFKR